MECGLIDVKELSNIHEPERYVCVWLDKKPDEPHIPSHGDMRWDMRPGDWWEIWPDLLTHPCAYLFAPQHPERDGPPRFEDWVESWPPEAEWEHLVPQQYHRHVRKILDALPSGPRASAISGHMGLHGASPYDSDRYGGGGANDTMLRQLVRTLLGVDEGDRQNMARLLSTLALAPDSTRTMDALKGALTPRLQEPLRAVRSTGFGDFN